MSDEQPDETLPRNKDELELCKLQLEISELRDAPKRVRRTTLLTTITAALTALTTVTVAVIGGLITWKVQQFTTQQHERDSYYTLLQGLGSINIPERAGAAVGLSRYARGDDPEMAEYTATLLTTQLATESDPRVLRILLTEIVKLGKPALPLLIQFNRSATARLQNLVQHAILYRLPPIYEYKKYDDGKRWDALAKDIAKLYKKNIRQAMGVGIDEDLMTSRERNVLANLWPNLLDNILRNEETATKQLFIL